LKQDLEKWKLYIFQTYSICCTNNWAIQKIYNFLPKYLKKKILEYIGNSTSAAPVALRFDPN
jgi:hypothetical protein